MTDERFPVLVAKEWAATYPDAAVGILVMDGVANLECHPGLEARKAALEAELRARFSSHDRAAFKSLPSIRPYEEYYGRFGKSYHVRLQLESVVLKGKAIPRVATLVEAMFMAELESQLLTAGHDAGAVEFPVIAGVARGDERYTRLDGQEQQLKPGDMMISDGRGILSSVLYGPDRRTRIVPGTTCALFTVYAPPGIAREAVVVHLKAVQEKILLVSPESEVRAFGVHGAE
jgi:DNA/RNA-binding domain of Phe-tRNA-synthetase-like protein